MLSEDDILWRRFTAYADRRNLLEPRLLGSGKDGVVHEAESNDFSGLVAVKAFYRRGQYEREKNVYLRLREKEVVKVLDCNIPQLVAYDDELLVVEMTVVAQPFILDFADAWLDEGPDFSRESWAYWDETLEEDFGERIVEVRQMLALLRAYGVIMLDVHPRNIRFE